MLTHISGPQTELKYEPVQAQGDHRLHIGPEQSQIGAGKPGLEIIFYNGQEHSPVPENIQRDPQKILQRQNADHRCRSHSHTAAGFAQGGQIIRQKDQNIQHYRRDPKRDCSDLFLTH